ncbi:uncharacterized protein LOC121386655 [Gigantopelta aegis]|uniref:uncharacterized protein LOC121386655 n=1 Tax=Gigantopelta aegis TaxID=1735272 RepID=UPI001B8887A6|nr:uncharacterized protein LOC121386655 [Gigantopelta aegis]
MPNPCRSYSNNFVSPMRHSESSMTFLKEFSVLTEFDEEHNCKIQSLIVLKSGAIIVADIKNGLTKVFDMEGTYLDSVHNGGRVFGLTVIGDTKFAVTINGRKQIAFYELVNGKLKLVNLVNTDRRYFGIARHPNGNLIVGTKEVLNLMTPEAETIGRMTSQVDFVNPYHICVTKAGSVVVVDSEKVCIVVFDSDGYVQRQIHVGYLYLRGIAVTDEVIFFVNNAKDHVFMISMNEDHVTRIYGNEKKLNKPTALCVLPDGKLIISEEEVIKIFKIDKYHEITASYISKLRTFKSFISSLPWRHVSDTIGLQGFLEIVHAVCVYI